MGTTEYTVVNHMPSTDYCLHKVGCRDIAAGRFNKDEVSQTYNITVTDGDDLVRAVDLDLFAASGISDDYGHDPRRIRRCRRTVLRSARVFPCTKEAK